MKLHIAPGNGNMSPFCRTTRFDISGLTPPREFIQQMIRNPSNCCQHCIRIANRKLPNMIANEKARL